MRFPGASCVEGGGLPPPDSTTPHRGGLITDPSEPPCGASDACRRRHSAGPGPPVRRGWCLGDGSPPSAGNRGKAWKAT
eukprot:570723-Alexandrium_andersonii.AAC.1